MRLFVGILLADRTANELSAISLRYQSPNDGLRWSLPQSWHVTLQFLGSVSEQQYACIISQLHTLQDSAVSIEIGPMDFFDHAGIFFAEVRATPELISLQQQITSATSHCGFAAESRRHYHPHITLARAKGSRGSAGLRELKRTIRRQPTVCGFISQEFLLYESHLTSSGSHYEVRERFPLARVTP